MKISCQTKKLSIQAIDSDRLVYMIIGYFICYSSPIWALSWGEKDVRAIFQKLSDKFTYIQTYVHCDIDSANHLYTIHIYIIGSPTITSGYYKLRGTLNMPYLGYI